MNSQIFQRLAARQAALGSAVLLVLTLVGCQTPPPPPPQPPPPPATLRDEALPLAQAIAWATDSLAAQMQRAKPAGLSARAEAPVRQPQRDRERHARAHHRRLQCVAACDAGAGRGGGARRGWVKPFSSVGRSQLDAACARGEVDAGSAQTQRAQALARRKPQRCPVASRGFATTHGERRRDFMSMFW